MTDMCARSFAEYLFDVGELQLTALLEARPDVLAQPVPRGFSQLAQRLGGAESLGAIRKPTKIDGVSLCHQITKQNDRRCTGFVRAST